MNKNKLLQQLLADSYILMLKTHNFHWNVTGPLFQSLHSLFEIQYNDLFLAVDLIAERMRSNDTIVNAKYSHFQKISKIKDSSETKYKKMIKELIESNKILVETAKKLITAAQEEKDEATADLAIERINVHEKNMWMLKSHLS
jgi:starvation-inducible DNA-binding protein